MNLNEDAFIDQFFFKFEIPKIITHLIELELSESISKQLFGLVLRILSSSNDLKLFTAFEKYQIIGIFKKYFMNEKDQIIECLELFSYLSSKYISARNKILKIIDIQFFCAYDDENISKTSYQLISSLCSFAMSSDKCDYIITILKNGINSEQFFVFDLIFQSLYKISFANEKNWFLIISNKEIYEQLLQYFKEEQFRQQILLINKRIVELNFQISEEFLAQIFDFLQVDSSNEESKSIEIISEIFLIIITNNDFELNNKNSLFENLLKFNIIDALLLISENGNFQSKVNSVYCITKIYHLFVKSDVGGSFNILLADKIVDVFINFLSIPQSDIICYILISLIKIINDSISLNLSDQIFTNQNEILLQENLDNLLLNDDSLIVEKSRYLINLILPIINQ